MQAISRAGGNVRCRLLLRVRRLWQFQRAEVVIADPFPVLVGVAEGVARAANARAKKARAAKFIMKVSAVLPHELSFGRLVERRLILQISVDYLELFILKFRTDLPERPATRVAKHGDPAPKQRHVAVVVDDMDLAIDDATDVRTVVVPVFYLDHESARQ